MLFTKKKRKKQSQGATKVFMLGRPLLVVDYDLQDIRFIRRSQIPLGSPTHFFSLEPFTILGINPRVSYADITNTAIAKADIYCSSLPDKDEYAREKEALRNAVNILGNQQSCIQYRSFARKYDQSRQMLSGSKMERRFAKAIIGHAPGLRKLQTIRNSKSGGILAVSLLVSLVLLIVVLTIPVGGVAIFGFTFLQARSSLHGDHWPFYLSWHLSDWVGSEHIGISSTRTFSWSFRATLVKFWIIWKQWLIR